MLNTVTQFPKMKYIPEVAVQQQDLVRSANAYGYKISTNTYDIEPNLPYSQMAVYGGVNFMSPPKTPEDLYLGWQLQAELQQDPH